MVAGAGAMITLTAAQQAAVEVALRQRTLTPRLRERLEMVKGAGLGHDLATIAAWSGRTPTTVQRWLTGFVTGGMAALADAPRAGRPPRADAAYRAALLATVQTPPRDLGLLFDVWTSARLSAYLAEQTGVVIAPSWLRSLLGAADWVSGRPKHTLHQLRDADEVAACEAELAAVGEKGGGGSRALRTALRG